MANNLEKIAEDYSFVIDDDRDYSSGLEYSTMSSDYINPNLRMFIDGIKDKKRRIEIERDINRLYSKYSSDLRRGNPVVSRAELLEQAWNIAEQGVPDGKEPIHVLNQQLYSNPGRQYQYINGVVGDKKKSKEIKEELGRAGKYAIKEGWPILGAGAGWLLANKWYNKYTGRKNKIWGLKGEKEINEAFKPIYSPLETLNPVYGPARTASNIAMFLTKRKAKKEAGVGLGARAGKSFRKPSEYLVPGKGASKLARDSGKFVIKEGAKSVWGAIRKPVAYGIGAYAAYKVIKYFLKRRKEKKLKQDEIERLESLRNEMAAQRQMFYMPPEQMNWAA